MPTYTAITLQPVQHAGQLDHFPAGTLIRAADATNLPSSTARTQVFAVMDAQHEFLLPKMEVKRFSDPLILSDSDALLWNTLMILFSLVKGR